MLVNERQISAAGFKHIRSNCYTGERTTETRPEVFMHCTGRHVIVSTLVQRRGGHVYNRC